MSKKAEYPKRSQTCIVFKQRFYRAHTKAVVAQKIGRNGKNKNGY